MSAAQNRQIADAIACLKRQQVDEARRLLMMVVEADQYNELAWLWLAVCMLGDDDIELCLENVLAINPDNETAESGLRILKQRTTPQDEQSAAPTSDTSSMIHSFPADANLYSPAGGTLTPEKLYVERDADRVLYEHCLKGDFCYVLTGRQMGKSSLITRIKRRIEADDYLAVMIDMQGYGKRYEQQFYPNLLTQIDSGLKLNSSPVAWLKREENAMLSPELLFRNFMREVVLERIQKKVIVFLDEVDILRSYQGELANNFFATIRAMYNARAQDAEFSRLGFVICGVARPDDLMPDKRLTPFNIGAQIYLYPFTAGEALHLATGLGLEPQQARKVINWVIDWTGGHPYLTQKLCGAIAEQPAVAKNRESIEALVRRLFFNLDEPDGNLEKYIAAQLSNATDKDPERAIPPVRILQAYYRILSGRVVLDTEGQGFDKEACEHLKLIGLVRVQNRRLVISNQIYWKYFDSDRIRDLLREFNISLETIESGLRELDKQQGASSERSSEPPLYQHEVLSEDWIEDMPAIQTFEQWRNELLENAQYRPAEIIELDDVGAAQLESNPSPFSSSLAEAYDGWVSSLQLDKVQQSPKPHSYIPVAVPKIGYGDDDEDSLNDLRSLRDEFADDELLGEFSGELEFAAEDKPVDDIPTDISLRRRLARWIDALRGILNEFGYNSRLRILVGIIVGIPVLIMVLRVLAPIALPPLLDLLIRSTPVVIAIALLIGAFVGVSVWQFISRRSERDIIEERLIRYEQETTSFLDIDMVEEPTANIRRPSLIQERLDQLFATPSYSRGIALLLERANLNFTAFEFLSACLMFAFLSYALMVNAPLETPIPAIAALGAFMIPFIVVRAIGNVRAQRFKYQLPNALELWVNALRSGYSVLQSVEALARDASEPASTEFRRVVQEVQIGIDMEDALEHAWRRVSSKEFDLVITAVNLQRDVGGNLAEILSVIAHTVRSKLNLTKDISLLLTPMYRVFLVLAGILPILQHTLLSSLFTSASASTLGQTLIAFAYILLSLLTFVAVRTSLLVRNLQREVYGRWTAVRTITIDGLIGATLLVLAIQFQIPLVFIAWLAGLLCIVVIDLRVVVFFSGLATLPVVIYLLPTLDEGFAEFVNGLRGIAARIVSGEAVITASVTNLCLVVSFIILVLGGLYITQRRAHERNSLQERLAQYDDKELPNSLRQIEMTLSFRERVLLPLISRVYDALMWLTPGSAIDRIHNMLEQAGWSIGVTSFFSLRFILTSGLCFIMLQGKFYEFVPRTDLTILLVPMMALLGWLMPVWQLRVSAHHRRRSVRAALPDALDLLVVGVEAGLGFDMAMGKVYEKWDNQLAIMFGRILREIQLGKLRRDALRDSARRLRLDEYTTFITAIIQADQLGVSMARILRIQADQMRVTDRQWVRERAEAYNFLNNFGLNVLLAPSIIMWLLAPIIESLLR